MEAKQQVREAIKEKLLGWNVCDHIDCNDRKCDNNCPDLNLMADQILLLLKKLGWIDPSEYIMPGEFGTPKAKEVLAEWAKANGYCKVPQLKVLNACTCDSYGFVPFQGVSRMVHCNECIAFNDGCQAQLDSIKKQIEEANAAYDIRKS